MGGLLAIHHIPLWMPPTAPVWTEKLLNWWSLTLFVNNERRYLCSSSLHLSRKRPSDRTKGYLFSWSWKTWSLPQKWGKESTGRGEHTEGICLCTRSLSFISILHKTLSQPKPPQQDPTAIYILNKGIFFSHRLWKSMGHLIQAVYSYSGSSLVLPPASVYYS